MSAVNEMNYRELVAKIQYITSLLPHVHDAYIADLVEALTKKD